MRLLRRRGETPPTTPPLSSAEADLNRALGELEIALGELRRLTEPGKLDPDVRFERVERRLARLEDLAVATNGASAAAPAREPAAREPAVARPDAPVVDSGGTAGKPDGAAAPPDAEAAAAVSSSELRRARRASLPEPELEELASRRSRKAVRAARKLGDGIVASEDFLDRVGNPQLSFIADVEGDEPILLVALADADSERDGLLSPTAIFAASSGLSVKRLMIRDVHGAFFGLGIPGRADSARSVAAVLSQLVSEVGVRRVVTVGGGASGFTAVLLGALAGADHAVAFAAPTVLDRASLATLEDSRWELQLARLDAVGKAEQSDLDLAAAVDEHERLRVDLHYCGTDILQRRHAERLDGSSRVMLHGCATRLELQQMADAGLAKLLHPLLRL
jgi:hypothetical protein